MAGIVNKKDEDLFGRFNKRSTFASPITKFFNKRVAERRKFQE